MCDRHKELVALGQELGYEGGELREFVKGQQAAERDERHERAEARKLELEAEEKKNLRQYELQKIKLSSPSSLGLEGTSIVETDRFGWTTVLKLVPKFSESEVLKYFQSFEKLMKRVECPKEYYCLLLQSVLTGKAQEVYSCLSDEQCANYETVKKIILKAYKQVPETYRLKFRHFRKNSSMTFIEFARCKQQYFNEWCNSMEVSTLEDLKELILTEDFKNNIPAEMKLYIEEGQVNKFTRIAELADEFALTHQFSKEWQDKKIHPKTFETKGNRQLSGEPVRNSQLKTTKHLSDMKCFFCEKKGHIIKDCFKHKTYLTNQKKPVNLVSSGSDSVLQMDEWKNTIKSFGNYLSKGSLAVSESGIRKPVTILRDTGAAISVVLKSSLPDDPVTGDELVLIGGFPDACIACPFLTIYLDTDYVSGLVKVAVTDTLPVKGVDILLGNDLGKESCLVNPIVMKTPTPEAEVAVVTRSGFVTDSDNYDLAQRDDVSLKHIFERCEEGSGNDDYVKEKFILKNNLLHRLSRPIFANSNEVIDQVVIPFKLRPKMISLAHDNIMSGHLGVNKTFKKIYDSFYWPSLRRDVKNFVNSCHKCQMAGKLNKPIPKAPLINIPVTGEPFEHIVIDIVGPLPRSKRGNCYILSIVDRMSRFPEAIPIRNAKAKALVQHLIAYFTRFGLPKTLQSDNGRNFTGKFFKDQMRNFGIKHITSTPYHPESQGVIERFHQTLKHILRKLCSGEDNLWDVMLPYALFALRQAPSETLGLSPFDLVFGHKVRGSVEVLRETWDDEKTEVYVADKIDNFKTKLFRAWDLARENQASAHQKNKIVYDRKAKSRVFEKGDLVLALFPKEGNSLKYKFSGPYKVLDKKGDTKDVKRIISKYPKVVRDEPGLTHLIEHYVELTDTTPIRQHPYRLNPLKAEILKGLHDGA
ncbi:uncharacterized protein LOC135211982 [Macrobrachium nipponense]|uniref:uncharacterized protein LOC135211982 n=1 Tax=Macrobrachium nipponense TaxID=159736 RepID=UPI0030C8C864